MNSSPSIPGFDRPPVSEALIDIRVDLLPEEILPKLERLHSQLNSEYPNKKTRYHWEGTFGFKETDMVASSRSQVAFGYFFESSDKKKLIQFRRDGFTFNRLKPDPDESWPGWKALRNEAKRAWEMYVETTQIREIKRLAVRYINQIVIRGENIELEDYLTAAPKIPIGLPQKLDRFFTRVEISIPDPRAKAIIVQAPSHKKFPDSVTLTLDIDVVREEPIPLDHQTIWETLDRFRDFKNTIFLSSLKERAKALFFL